MERNYGKIRNRTKTLYGFPSTNRWTDRTNQCHIGTIPTSIYQLSTRRLVWLLTTCGICIQQRISRNHQGHTILHKLRHQPQIRDDQLSDLRQAGETRRNHAIRCVIEKQDGGTPITTKRILRSTPKTRSEPTIRRYGVGVGTQHQDHKTIEETGLEENRTIQNLGKSWDKRI